MIDKAKDLEDKVKEAKEYLDETKKEFDDSRMYPWAEFWMWQTREVYVQAKKDYERLLNKKRKIKDVLIKEITDV